MRRIARALSVLLATTLVACATPGSADWNQRLRGDAIVLLGEVHDNANQHRLRLATLQRAFVAGWRPAIAMEQFDLGRQADIDRARRERPGDAAHLIAAAAPATGEGGWNWALYQPFVELALQYDVHPFIGNTFGPLIFMICVLGGLGNMLGGFAAAFIISQIIAIGGYYGSTELSYVFAFTLFIVLMIVRPRGILAR